jgi:hypothetical protein
MSEPLDEELLGEFADRFMGEIDEGVTITPPPAASSRSLSDDADGPDPDDVDDDGGFDAAEPRSLSPEARARTLALAGIETRAAGHDTHPGGERLHLYWTKGEGLAKWIESDHQFYTLRDLLAEATEGKVPLETLSRWAASWVHEVTGNWPSSDAHRVAEGHKPRGKHVGPG